MGITYRCDPELHCTFEVWDSHVTPEQWRAHFDAVLADPAFPPGRKILVDLRTAAGATRITAAVVTEIGRAMNDAQYVLHDMRLAIVPNGAWDKAQLLIDEEISISGLVGITFSGLDQACAWLGLPVGQVSPVLREMREELTHADRG